MSLKSKKTIRPSANTRIGGRHHKGRGATSNRGSRFQPLDVEWDEGIEGPSPVTECRAVQAHSIISRNNSPDIPFEQSINPYLGCEHGCIYCYARPTHAYLDLSPGLDFETKLTYKENAAEQLQKELAKKSYRCRSITLGANTDPYQPVEKTRRITRQLLQVLHDCEHPVAIITKGALVTRDIDLLAAMAEKGLSAVTISITTLESDLKCHLEPRAPSAAARFAAIAALADAGVPVGLLCAPMIPALNDAELERILERAAAAGATRAAYTLLRMPLEIKALFEEWLHTHYPLRAEHVLSLMRQSRGGADNDSRFGHRMRGTGAFADILAQRFRLATKNLGLETGETFAMNTTLFRPPAPASEANTSSQMGLF